MSVSITTPSNVTARTQFLHAGNETYAYRRFGGGAPRAHAMAFLDGMGVAISKSPSCVRLLGPISGERSNCPAGDRVWNSVRRLRAQGIQGDRFSIRRRGDRGQLAVESVAPFIALGDECGSGMAPPSALRNEVSGMWYGDGKDARSLHHCEAGGGPVAWCARGEQQPSGNAQVAEERVNRLPVSPRRGVRLLL
jgi:hypothetical protein